MDVALVMSRSDGAQRTFPLRKDRIVVGRTSSCDLRIPLSSVSRQHCEIIKGDEQVRLRDLGSSNGTFCNDKRVQEVVLEAGDRLTIGTVQFQVVIDGQPELPSTPVLRHATPNSRSGRTAAGMASPASRKDRSGSEQEREGATVGDATSLDHEDPIAALEAMATSGIEEVEGESDAKMMPDAISTRDVNPKVSRHPRPQPRA